MRITFPVRRLSGSVIPDPDDNPVYIPPTLQPVIEYVGVLGALSLQVSLVAQSDSHCVNRLQDQAQSQASTITIVDTLASGLWHLRLNYSFIASFAPAAITGQNLVDQAGVRILDQAQQGNSYLILHKFIASTPVTLAMEFIVNIPTDGYLIGIVAPVTGVGQTTSTLLSVYAGRIG